MGSTSQQTDLDDWPAAVPHQAQRRGDFALICEHASSHIPAELGDLGLGSAARYSHAAWDIGAEALARALADRLNAPLICGGISRLVYDCNRPLNAPDAIPVRSELYEVPGNADLTEIARTERFELVHNPFHAAVADMLDRAGPATSVVTVHSFTPVYRGERRDLEIGYLCDRDDRLARAALSADGGARSALNKPYSALDGVTYTLRRHAVPRGLDNVMVEVRNDLLAAPDGIAAMADHLERVLRAARAGICP